MHQTVKTIFRLCLAAVIFLVTLSLMFTCVAKVQEILKADQYYQQAVSIPLKAVPKHNMYWCLIINVQTMRCLSLLRGNGYVAKISCEHYVALCTDDYNPVTYPADSEC